MAKETPTEIKPWTGKEVGQTLIAGLAWSILHEKTGEDPPLTQEQFLKMERVLESEKDKAVYAVYKSFYYAATEAYNNTRVFLMQFDNGAGRLRSALESAINAERRRSNMLLTPLVMTRTKYNALQSKALENYRSENILFSEVLSEALDQLLFFPEDTNAPEKLKTAVQKASKKRIKDPKVLASLSDCFLPDGKYILPDGGRSEEVPEDLQEIPLTDEDRFRLASLFFGGAPAIKAAYKEQTGKELIPAEDKLIESVFEEIVRIGGIPRRAIGERTTFQLANLQLQLSTLLTGAKKAPTWEETDVSSITGSKLLRDLRFTSFLFPVKDESRKITESLFSDTLNLLYNFLLTFPSIAGAVAREEERSGYAVLAKINCGDLIDDGVFPYAQRGANQDFLIRREIDRGEGFSYDQRKRASSAGIAILEQRKINTQDDLFGGGYAVNDSFLLEDNYDVLTLIRDQYSASFLEYLRDELLIPAARIMLAFNEVFRAVGKKLDIDAIDAFLFDEEEIRRRIRGYNTLSYTLYLFISGDADEREERRKAIKALFPEITSEELALDQKEIDAFRDALKKTRKPEKLTVLVGDLMGTIQKIN